MNTLKNEITTDPSGIGFTGMSNDAVAEALNAPTIPAKQSIQTAAIKKYLLLTDRWLDVKQSTEMAAKVSVDALELFDSFTMDDAAVEAKISQMMEGLVDASLITASDKTAILAMGNTSISRATELGLGIVTAGQVQAERN